MPARPSRSGFVLPPDEVLSTMSRIETSPRSRPQVSLHSPMHSAVAALVALARDAGLSDPGCFAMSWLAAARMATVGTVSASGSGLSVAGASEPASIDPSGGPQGRDLLMSLADPDTVARLVQAGLPAACADQIEGRLLARDAGGLAVRAEAIRLMVDLDLALGRARWDMLPLLGAVLPRTAQMPWLTARTVTTLGDLMGHPTAAWPELWIPFDATGQLTIAALRRGWRVVRGSPWAHFSWLSDLLMTVETGRSRDPRVRESHERDSLGMPVFSSACALVVPPCGPQARTAALAGWDPAGHGAGLDRGETWALAVLRDRAAGRTVFAGPQSLLAGRGPEARLRHALLHESGRGSLVAVIQLAGGARDPASALVFEPGQAASSVWMADVSDALPDDLIALMANRGEQPGRAVRVARDALVAGDCNLQPARQLRRLAEPGRSTVRLGEICRVIRPPASAPATAATTTACEVGLPELGQWRPVDGASARMASLRQPADERVRLQSGDLVMSIKGTVGRIGLIGDLAGDRARVLSQSCLGLRLSRSPGSEAGFLSSEYLLMFLRSPHAQAQLASLQAGTTVRHLNPATLLEALQVPVPSADEHVDVLDDYRRLCELEVRMAALSADARTISAARWRAA
jgi:hypothetical protein